MLHYGFGAVLVLLTAHAGAEKCTTPNNKEGECISLYLCSVLLDGLCTKQNASIELVRRSSCGGSPSDPLVCCDSSSSITTTEKINSGHTNQNYSRSNLIPDRRYCGYQHADDYYRNENATGIDEFPWLAALVYQDKNAKKITRCGGSLITNRYVLTTANCLLNYNLVAVRLGEYNTKTHIDCIKNTNIQFDECADEPEDFGIEKTIPHPTFNKTTYSGDIGLVRLNRTVTYSDYIRPICLPTAGTKFANDQDILTSTGFGVTHDGYRAEIKKKVLLQLTSNEECAAANQKYAEIVTENHFCTKQRDNSGEFLCGGDAGVPIMFSVRNQWHQEGISSIGARGCGTKIPDIHIKVVNYLNWIVANIEP